MPLAPIVLGHNAFFGVDHLSAERGAARAAAFSDPANVLRAIHDAVQHGAGGMMMSSHERAGPIADMIRQDKTLAGKLLLYPLIPYAQKYVTRANEVGLVNVVLEQLQGGTWSEKLAFFWKAGRGVVMKETTSILAALIRLELNAFRGLDIGAVFLHDALTDLALGLGLEGIFAFYIEEVRRTHGCDPAFATKNFPMLIERFGAWGLPRPTVLTHFNKIGYHMNPTRQDCEKTAALEAAHVMAMGTLASGHLRPDEAYDYLAGVKGIESVVVGVSSSGHAAETFAALKAHGWGR